MVFLIILMCHILEKKNIKYRISVCRIVYFFPNAVIFEGPRDYGRFFFLILRTVFYTANYTVYYTVQYNISSPKLNKRNIVPILPTTIAKK